MVTLAYINYEWSASNAVKRSFSESTGLDLDNTLARFWVAYRDSVNGTKLDMAANMTGVCSYFDAQDLLYTMFHGANSCVTKEEIADAMARTCSMPSDDDRKAQSWYIVIVEIAQQVAEYADNLNQPKKKADSSEV